MSVAAPLTLREGDLARLEALTRSTSVRAGLAQRARIVLLAAQGLPNSEIARRTGSTRPTVLTWRQRYAEGGIEALEDRPRSGRPSEVDEVRVVAATLANNGKPPAHLGAPHWTSRLLAEHLDVSYTTVARIWRKWGIQPQRVHAFRPALSAELQAALAGLYHGTSSERGVPPAGRPGSRKTGRPDPWTNLVELSLAIITHQAIRRGTFATVYNLIEAIGALTDGWGERDDPAHRTPVPPPGAAGGTPFGAAQAKPDRKQTSSTRQSGRRPARTEAELRRTGERPAGRPRERLLLRAEFPGTRNRPPGPASG